MFGSASMFVRRFGTNAGGAIAPMFAFVLVLIAAAAGISIDYGRAFSSRTAVQSSLDAALFAAAKAATMNGADTDAEIKNFFDKTALQKHGVNITTVEGKLYSDGVFRAHATGKLDTTFMSIAGTNYIPIEVKSEVVYGLGNAEVALVLDASDSMTGTKFDTLKTAAKDLVDVLYQAPAADKKVKVGLVPFGHYVNVGLANRNEPWISVPADYSTTNNICTTTRPILSKDDCSDETYTYTVDGVEKTGTREVCSNITYGDEVTSCSDVTSNYIWRGCVGSRNYPLNTEDGDYGNQVPGLLNIFCPSEISPMSKDKDTIKTNIDAMTTSGNTYIPSGLAWGWRVLSNQAPFTESADDPDITSSTKVNKYMVVMTDGANTRSPGYPDHNGGDVTLANTLTTELCTNIKTDGVRVFTIAFDVVDPVIVSLLEGCASTTADHYVATNNEQLITVFKQIASNIAEVRLYN